MKTIRVLVVDDSVVFREILARGIQSDNQIEVVAKAVDAYDARDKIIKHRPDVVTCDIEMPKMNGIEFVRKLIPQYPVPVIVVSAVDDVVFDAMDAGAVDFIAKPNPSSPKDVEAFVNRLIAQIKSAAKATVQKVELKTIKSEKKVKKISHHKLIAIGASTGGTEAIFSVLKQLPKDIPGIIIVQHIPPIFSAMFAERLNNQTHFSVKEARTGDVVQDGHVYLAPGDKHIQVRVHEKQMILKAFSGEKVNGHCPSVDVMMNSVAKEIGDKAMGIILTGMGYDGAKGIAMMKRRGAITIGQDEASSVVYGMPKAAYELGGITKQTALELMGHQIMKHLI